MKTALRWAVDILLRLVLLVFIWGMMSVSGMLFEPLKWEGAVDIWRYVSQGEMKHDIFARKAAKYTFPKNSYRTYINPGTDANLAASGDYTSAYAAGDTLYYRVGNAVLKVQPKDDGKRTRLARWEEPGALIGTKRTLLSANAGQVSMIRLSDGLCYRAAEAGWMEEGGDFPALADRLYDLLTQQERRRITSVELAALACHTTAGTLLDYRDGTAWLADSTTQPGTVVLYRQDGPGSREEVLRYQNSYTGHGAGRFIARGVFVYAGNQGLSALRLEDGDAITFQPDKVGIPARAVNYALDQEGTLWLLFVDEEDRVIRISYDSVGSGTIVWQRAPLDETGRGERLALYTVGDQWWLLRGEGDQARFYHSSVTKEVGK